MMFEGLFSLYIICQLKRSSCERRMMLQHQIMYLKKRILCHFVIYRESLLEEYHFLSCLFHLDGFAGTLLRKHFSHKHALGTVAVILYIRIFIYGKFNNKHMLFFFIELYRVRHLTLPSKISFINSAKKAIHKMFHKRVCLLMRY